MMSDEVKIIGRMVHDDGTKVVFPIKRNIVVCGTEYVKTLNKGAKVKCHMCGKKMVVDNNNTINFEEMQYVCCPECGAKVSVLYYFGKEISDEPKQGKGKGIRSYVG